jgi:hypothetical protein
MVQYSKKNSGKKFPEFEQLYTPQRETTKSYYSNQYKYLILIIIEWQWYEAKIQRLFLEISMVCTYLS